MAKHKIRAKLYDNLLTPDPNDFSARVISESSLTIRDICESSATRGGADVSAPAMQHGVELFLKEMAYLLCDGFSVNTGYFTAVPSIRGAFNSPNENFNSSKHSILFQFTQGEAMRKEIANVEVEILGVAEAGTEIMQVTDVKTGSVNDQITPNRNLKIIGSRIKLVGDHPDIGLVFIDETNPSNIFKVEMDEFVVNNPSELIIVIPEDMPIGQYKLQLTTQYAISKLLKTPRTVVFDKILTVQ